VPSRALMSVDLPRLTLSSTSRPLPRGRPRGAPAHRRGSSGAAPPRRSHRPSSSLVPSHPPDSCRLQPVAPRIDLSACYHVLRTQRTPGRRCSPRTVARDPETCPSYAMTTYYLLLTVPYWGWRRIM
jgi:hypothetical protein